MHASQRAGSAHRARIVAELSVFGVGALPAVDRRRVVELEVGSLRETFGRALCLAVGDRGLEHAARRRGIARAQCGPSLTKAVTAGPSHAVIFSRVT